VAATTRDQVRPVLRNDVGTVSAPSVCRPRLATALQKGSELCRPRHECDDDTVRDEGILERRFAMYSGGRLGATDPAAALAWATPRNS